jgi:hypothetical protein
MNFRKFLLIFLFTILTSINFAQEKAEFNCGNEFEIIETEIKSQETVSYKIVSSKKLYSKESFEFSEGIIIISDLNINLNLEEIMKTVATIGVKNKLSEIIAFKSCKAVEIYYKISEPTLEQKNYLEKNLIGELKIDINKSLNKKERKRNKKKRDFIEKIGNESCAILANSKIENFSSEKLSNVVISNTSENVAKMIKVYDLSFEEGSILFMKDLTYYIIDNCKLVQEYIKIEEK